MSDATASEAAAEPDSDRTKGRFTSAKLQALLDAQVNPKVVNRRDLATALRQLGVRITVHGVEAWFRRVDSNYSRPRVSLSAKEPSFEIPHKHWPLLIQVFSLAPEELRRSDDEFAGFCLALRHSGTLANDGLKKAVTPEQAELSPVDRSRAEHLPGREGQLEELLSELAKSEEQGARLVLLEGAPGLGKTTLLEELVRRTRLSNRMCITASCFENAYVPLLPLLDLVRLQRSEVARGGPDSLRIAQELTLRIELANEEEDGTGHVKSAAEPRSALFLLGSDLLVSLAQHAPLTLVVDDVHWLDSTTRDLLLHFARFLRLNRQHRVLMVFAAREFSRELLHQLPTGDFTRRLALEPLAKLELKRAAHLRLGTGLSPLALDFVWNISQGNPLYVEQLCTHLLSSQQLEERNGQLDLVAPADAIHVPETLDDFYRRRFEALDPKSATLLQLAACLGQQVNADFLQLLMPDTQTDVLLEALDRGEHSGLLHFVNNAYEFCHPVARHAVYMAMSDAQRSQQHAMVAETIAHALPDPTPHACIELAYHLVRGRPFTVAAQTMHACRIAAGHSARLAAWPSTEYFASNALELDALGGGLSNEQRGELLRLRGSSRHQTARPAIALQDLTLALERFNSSQNTEEYARTLSQIVRIRSNFVEVRDGRDQAAEELGEYVELLGGASNQVAADALEVLASYRLANNDSQAAQGIAERVIRAVVANRESGSGSPTHQSLLEAAAKSQITAGLACLNQLELQAALTYLLEAARSARESSSEPTLVRALQRLVLVQLLMGRIDEVFTTNTELEGLGGATLTGEHSVVCAAVSAALAIRGNFEESRAVAEDGLELVDVTGYRFLETELVGNQVFSLLRMGRFAVANEAIARLEVHRPGRAAALLRNALSVARDRPEPLSANNRLSALSERPLNFGELARVMMLAELAVASADEEVLLALLPKLQKAERSGVLFTLAWPVQLPLLMGRIYLALGKERNAHYYLRKSLDFGQVNELAVQLQIVQQTLQAEWPAEQELLLEVNAALEQTEGRTAPL